MKFFINDQTNGLFVSSSTINGLREIDEAEYFSLLEQFNADFESAQDDAIMQLPEDIISQLKFVGGELKSSNFGRLVKFYDAISRLSRPANLNDTSDRGLDYVGIAGYGDSMANLGAYTGQFITDAMMRVYGIGGIFSPGAGFSDQDAAAGWAFTGGAAQPRTDYSYFPSAVQLEMSDGSTASMTLDRVAYSSNTLKDAAIPIGFNAVKRPRNIKQIEVYYLTRPGDGSLTVNINGVDTETIDCDGPLDLGQYIFPYTTPEKDISIRLSSSGETRPVLVLFRTGKGVISLNCQRGGSSMDQQSAYIDNGNISGVFRKLCEFLNVRLFIHQQRAQSPVDPNLSENYDAVFEGLRNNIPGADQLVLTELPYGSTAPQEVKDASLEVNALLAEKVKQHNLAFYDIFTSLAGNEIDLTSLGFNDKDPTHADPSLHRLLASQFLEEFNYFRPALVYRTATLDDVLKTQTSVFPFNEAGKMVMHCQGPWHTLADINSSGSGYGYSSEYETGFRFSAGAEDGHSSGRLGLVSDSIPINTNSQSSVYTMRGYRNTDLNANHRAFIVFGCNTNTPSNPEDLIATSQKAFGLEFAKSSDVGMIGDNEHFRLFISDGSSISYSGWALAAEAGQAPVNSTGLDIVLHYDRNLGLLKCSANNSTDAFDLTLTLDASQLVAERTSGPYCCAGVYSDGVATPSASSFLGFTRITAQPLVRVTNSFD